MVFRKVLVALDRSKLAPTVFTQALTMGSLGQVLLFNCIDWQLDDVNPWLSIGTLADANVAGTWYQSYHEELQQKIQATEAWLDNYAQMAKANSVSIECECKIGSPGSAICDRARSWGATLIVIGRRGHRGISEIVLGSVSNYVIHHAPCSVLVVQEMNLTE